MSFIYASACKVVLFAQVDENMQRAQRRGACGEQRFWWRRHVRAPAAPPAGDDYLEMTVNEIVNGKVRPTIVLLYHSRPLYIFLTVWKRFIFDFIV